MIELRGVSKVFSDGQGSEFVAVKGVDLVIATGETLCLIGTSGSGKSTTLRLINRLIERTSGTVAVEGEDVAGQDPIALRRRMGYVVQSGGLFPHMTVGENVGLLCKLEGWEGARIDARVAELLDLVNLPADTYGARYPKELSGGQRQRVSVARALALDPPYLLMDEPFGALDPITRDQLHAEFERLKASVGKTIVLVTHDMAEAFRLGDRVALMHGGRLVQVGDEADFRVNPADAFVSEFLGSYLGHA